MPAYGESRNRRLGLGGSVVTTATAEGGMYGLWLLKVGIGRWVREGLRRDRRARPWRVMVSTPATKGGLVRREHIGIWRRDARSGREGSGVWIVIVVVTTSNDRWYGRTRRYRRL